MTNIRSSWNSDRVASCCFKKGASARTADRKPYFLAQYKGREVSVLGPRGGVKFVLTMSGAVASAIVRNGVLSVETIDGSTFSYEAATGRLLSAAPAPVAVVSAASTSRVSAA